MDGAAPNTVLLECWHGNPARAKHSEAAVRAGEAQRGKLLSAMVELPEEPDRRESERRRAAAIMRQIRANIETRRREWPPDMPAADGVGLIHECREERERKPAGGQG